MRLLLLTIVAFAAVPPLVFAVILLFHFSDSQRGRAEENLMASAAGVARSIDAEFATALATLDTLKNSSFLQQGDLSAFEQRLRDNTLDTGRGFTLLDAGGKQLINTSLPPRTGLPHIEQRALRTAFRDRRLYISEVIHDAGSGEVFAFVGIPIVRDHDVKWTLGTFLYGSDFAGVIAEPGVPEDWIVSIVDRRGTHIRRSHLNEEFAGRPLVPVLLRQMEAGRSGVLRTISHEGIALISTVAYAPLSGWAAAVGLPVQQLEAPLHRSLQSLAATGLVMAGVALALALSLAHVLDRGFLKLRRSAQVLDRGDLVQMQHSAVREVNDIVASMTQVSQNLAERRKALADLNDSLEIQVAERTAELTAEMQRREESEAQLHRLRRMEAIGKLTGGIAHDFNNMLAVVISSLSLMQRRLARGDTDVQRFIESAMQGAESAASLTRRLLAFSRQQTLKPESVSCNKLITGMSDLLRHTIPEHIEIETVLAGGLWRTYVDPSGLESAILNLVVNARDAMPQGGRLTIESANAHLDEAYAAQHPDVSAGQYVMVAVTDTGSGIPDDIIDSVFEPFFTTKQPGYGTGLGLSQVHGFIKQSGGHIKIYSEEAHGTAVKLYLPRLVSEASTARDSRGSGAQAVSLIHGSETILVVEDEATVRQGAVTMLEELGYTVLEAEGGAQALEVLDAHTETALLITDVVMPGMNGRQLAEEAVRRRPALRVLFTTGYTRNAIVHHGILDPDVQLITKPYTLEALSLKISEVLSSAARPTVDA